MRFIKTIYTIVFLHFFGLIKTNNLKKSYNRYIKKRLLSEDECNLKTLSCFECNSPLKSCVYNQDICSVSTDNDTTELFWYSKLMTCKDKESDNKMSNYCGTINIDTSNREIEIRDSKLYGSNSIENLFCSWEFSKSKEIGNIKVNFKDIYETLVELELYLFLILMHIFFLTLIINLVKKFLKKNTIKLKLFIFILKFLNQFLFK